MGYEYDDSGSMAGIFVLTVLSLVLIPLTLLRLKAALKRGGKTEFGCRCIACEEKKERLSKEGTKTAILHPGVG